MCVDTYNDPLPGSWIHHVPKSRHHRHHPRNHHHHHHHHHRRRHHHHFGTGSNFGWFLGVGGAISDAIFLRIGTKLLHKQIFTSCFENCSSFSALPVLLLRQVYL